MVRNALGERAPARACRFDSCPLRQITKLEPKENKGLLVQ